MDIVPVDDELIIEARLHPDDIDVVHPGLPAEVRLTAFKRSTTPTIDAHRDLRFGRHADRPAQRRKLLPLPGHAVEAVAAPVEQIMLTPGMPAEVMIVTGERRAFEYFLTPLKERMRHAFREE